MINCPKCNNPFDPNGKWGLRKFCSRSCANSKSFSEEAIQKKSDAAKANVLAGTHNTNKGKHHVDRVDWFCKGCKKKEQRRPLDTKVYCSKKCEQTYKVAGGYRENSGRAKTGYYQGIYCGSTYELCWVIYNLDHQIEFTRFPSYLQKDDLKYYPDFLLSDGKTIVEIKGFEGEDVARKTALAEEYGYTVQLLKKEDLAEVFAYVEHKFQTKKYETLYDGYKPSYSYICNGCNINFQTDNKRRSETVYCTKSCSMKANRKNCKKFALV